MYQRGLGLILGLFVLVSPVYAEVSPESIIQIYQRLDTLEKEARVLHGENEVLKHQIEKLKKVQKQGFLNVDERIDELADSIKPKAETTDNTEQAVEKNTEESPEKKTEADKQTAVVKVLEKPAKPVIDAKKEEAETKPKLQTDTDKSDTKSEAEVKVADTTTEKKTDRSNNSAKQKSRAPSAYEKETYQAAFNKMNASPTAATNSFKEYIKMQPNSPLAANAQYWIGEIMYSHNNYKGAVQEFIKVLQKYKYSNKAPDAAIKLGYSFYALKNWPYARRTFEDVLKYFPENKNAVNLATQRLKKMKAAGH